MQNLFFILSKFLQMSKLLYNILKISGVKMPPPLVACLVSNEHNRTETMQPLLYKSQWGPHAQVKVLKSEKSCRSYYNQKVFNVHKVFYMLMY